MGAITVTTAIITAILSFLTFYYFFQNSSGVLSFLQAPSQNTPNPHPSPTSNSNNRTAPPETTTPQESPSEHQSNPEEAAPSNETVTVTSPSNVTVTSSFHPEATSANTTEAAGAANTTEAGPIEAINITETSELSHGPLITVRLESGAMLRIAWLLGQGQSPSFTINTDTEGIVYSLDSPSRNLYRDVEVTSPFTYNESSEEGGLYTLRLKNTANFSNGVITHVIPNASDIVLETPVPIDQTVSSGPSSDSQHAESLSVPQFQGNETQAISTQNGESLSVPQPKVTENQSTGPQTAESSSGPKIQPTGTETPVATIAAFSGVFAAAITAGTTIWVHKKEKQGSFQRRGK